MEQIFKKINNILTTCLVALLCLLGDSALGQGVTAVRDGTRVTVTNNTGHNIVLFRADMTGSNARRNNSDFDGAEVRGAGIDIPRPTHNHYTVILNGRSETFEQDSRGRIAGSIIYYIGQRPLGNPREVRILSPIEYIAATTPAALPTVQNQAQPETQQTGDSQDQPTATEITRPTDTPAPPENHRHVERTSDAATAPSGTTDVQRQDRPGVSPPAPAATPGAPGNQARIADFRREIGSLRDKCNALLQQAELSPQDSAALITKQNLCATLISQLNSFQENLTDAGEKRQIEELKKQLETLQEEIVIRLGAAQLRERFRNAVYPQLLASLDSIRSFIDANRNKPDWYNWWGKWNYSNRLNSIEKTGSLKARNFIDSISRISEYQTMVSILEFDFQNQIQNRIERYRNILDGQDFRVPVVKLLTFGIMLLIVIVVAVVFVYMKRHNQKMEKEKKQKEEEKIAALGKSTFKKIDKTNATQPESYKHGLSEVKADAGRLYKEIDMFDFVEDSSIHKIYISRQLIEELHKFFSDSLRPDGKIMETGCYVVGRWDYASNTDHSSTGLTNQQAYDISLEYMVEPGSDARYSEFECEFGLEIGTSLVINNRKYSEQSNSEYVHTSWVHSHPGLQLFLSKQDLIVQATLTNNSPYKRMLAMVIDTKTEGLKMAFFSPKASEQQVMNNDSDLKKTITLDELLEWAKTPIGN